MTVGSCTPVAATYCFYTIVHYPLAVIFVLFVGHLVPDATEFMYKLMCYLIDINSNNGMSRSVKIIKFLITNQNQTKYLIPNKIKIDFLKLIFFCN